MAVDLDRVVPLPSSLDLKKQAYEVPGTRKPGQTGHYRNAPFGLADFTTDKVFKSLREIFETGLALNPELSCLGHRPIVSTNPLKYADHFEWITYAGADARRQLIGSALHTWFNSGMLGGGDMQTVGIWSQNRPEWQLVELALNAYGKVGVSLYDTLGKDSVEYIINHAHLTVIFVTANHIPSLLKLVPRTPQLKMIVSLDDLSPETKQILTSWAETLSVQVKELHEVEEFGKANLLDLVPATPYDPASICYTSGTTNRPKGVVLTHGQLASACSANIFGYILPSDDRGCVLSYLPLAHIYERINELCMFAVGGNIGFFSGDPLRLLEDAQLLRPNFFPSVPRVLNRVYQSAMLAGNVPGLKGALFRKAVQVKLDKLHATGDNTHVFWDKLVFRKIQAVLGGRVELISCGSAPISREVMDFLKIAFGGTVMEAFYRCRKHRNSETARFSYGMTENAAVCTHTLPGDPSSSGTVGPPTAMTEIKLIDVPAMGYTAEDKPYPRGELCCRGVNCFSKYYKDEKTTRETTDEEGWVHTGDVAAIDECGRIKIIDRVKNIMKLAQGEYVAIEKVEGFYALSPIVSQIFVHGDSLKSYLLAVVVADPIQFAAMAKRVIGSHVSVDDVRTLQELCKDQRIVDAVMKELNREAKKNALNGFEMVRRIHVSLDPFTIEDNTLTPTLKLRRKDAFNKYKLELTALYDLPDPESTPKQTKL
ncbi:hypothetical protein EW146_g977 [Bondarzewia mesenterica]|uniref:AMP-dependent synthetase/ligase domain-containing protein n=1 Tax=Bondarzewia mesenterica TaxID=1095465 RepID=A0A4V3XG77_9AGAM|nr:hypothetical protein EW146_g977 [Bondarzewia mesenterica]